jgi:hypothetical protein
MVSVYHPGVFTKLNKIVFISQTHLFFIVLMYYSGNMFRLSIESVFLCKGLMMTQ